MTLKILSIMCTLSLVTGLSHAHITTYAQHLALGAGLGFATDVLIHRQAARHDSLGFNNAENKYTFAYGRHENLQVLLGLSAGTICYIAASTQDGDTMPLCFILSFIGHYVGSSGWRDPHLRPLTTKGFSMGLTLTSLVQAYQRYSNMRPAMSSIPF